MGGGDMWGTELSYNDGSVEQSSNADTYELLSESDYVSQSGAGAEADDDAGTFLHSARRVRSTW